MVSGPSVGYSTNDEVAFIGDLGRRGGFGLSRLEMLRRYRAALNHRVRWGRMVREVVLREIDAAISKEATWSTSRRVRA